jgi:hypothetical protein
MPLWLSASLGALVRYVLFGIGTFMVSKGYWDQTVADTFVDGALAQILSWLLMIGPIVWMVVVKYLDKITLFNSLLTPSVITEEAAKAMPTPSVAEMNHVRGAGGTGVGALLLALVLAGGVTACAKVNPALVATEDSVHDAIAKVDDGVRAECADPALAAPCADVRPLVLELVVAGKAFNRSVADQNVAGLTDVVVAAGRLAEKLKSLPQGRTVQIVKDLASALAAASKGVK